jgi:hypothetical protein
MGCNEIIDLGSVSNWGKKTLNERQMGNYTG